MTLLHIVDSVESPSGSTGAPCGLLTPLFGAGRLFFIAPLALPVVKCVKVVIHRKERE